MSPFCPLWISRVGPTSKSYLLDHVIIHLLTKLVCSRWLNIGLIHFSIFIDQNQAVPCGTYICNFFSRATRKSFPFHRNHLLGTLDFTSSECWAPFNFSDQFSFLGNRARYEFIELDMSIPSSRPLAFLGGQSKNGYRAR